MRLYSYLFAALLLLPSVAFSMEPNEDLYKTCQEKVRNGSYGGPTYNKICEEHFNMPDPLLIKCIRWGKEKSFPNDLELRTCRFYCENNKDWGAWYDFEIPLELKESFRGFKGMHFTNRCFIDVCPALSGKYKEESGSLRTIESSRGEMYRTYRMDGGEPLEATGYKKLQGEESYRAYCSDKSLTVERFKGSNLIETKTLEIINAQGDLREKSATGVKVLKKISN